MSLNETILAAQAYLDPQQVDCLVYHNPCPDGSGAAVAGWFARGDAMQYLPLNYSKKFDQEKLRDKNIVFIDCSVKKEQLLEIRAIAKTVMILDHHDSAAKDLAGVAGCFFYMLNSGAILGWHYFNGIDEPAPDVLKLIEDRDLWLWRHRDRSEPLYHALVALPKQPGFQKLAALMDPTELARAIEYGREVMRKNKEWCLEKVAHARHCKFKLPNQERVYDIIALEVPEERLVSELAEELCKQFAPDFVMLWYRFDGNRYKLSFRNNKADINVGDIASILGGGGHPRAAGATIDFDPTTLFQ
jgi:oligoribonuclease NrnB/cAMP/cGMP phosphodiesterase (DHH superfamily)